MRPGKSWLRSTRPANGGWAIGGTLAPGGMGRLLVRRWALIMELLKIVDKSPQPLISHDVV